MKKGQKIEIEIPNSAEYISMARQTVEQVGKRLGFSTDEQEDISIAVGEACTNAVKHGKSPTGECYVQIMCEVIEEGLSVEITNNVVDFSMPSLTTEPDTNKSSGYGLFIMSSVMDELNMTRRNGSVTVKMTKKMKMPGASENLLPKPTEPPL